jgi:hypothetical protein
LIEWSELEGSDPRDVLLVGNGPSRNDPEALELQRWWPHCLIGCNAYWRTAPRTPDYLVCFDRDQVAAAADFALPPGPKPDGTYAQAPLTPRGKLVRVVAPPPAHSGVGWPAALADSLDAMAVVTAPNFVNAALHMAADQEWHPRIGALGNFAGHLACQLAWLLGARRVYLLGVDCAGRLKSDGQVHLSAVDSAVRGYAAASLPKVGCTPLPDGSWRPSGWGFSVDLWRALIAAAAHAGVRIRRALSGGALDFVEVERPGSD